MKYGFRRGLPTMRAPSKWTQTKIFSAQRLRQIQRALHNLKVTLLCGIVTILVLRGSFGAGNFGTPVQDLNDIREFLPRRTKAGRVILAEAKVLEDKQLKNDEYGDQTVQAYRLGPKISDWNQQRAEWLVKNPHMSSSVNADKPRILLVTGSQPNACDNPVGDHYLLKSLKNKMDYCRLHKVEIFYNMAHLDQEMSGFWAKLPLIRKLMLSHPEVEWIWWMDSDAMFTDMTFELPMERYKQHNLILHGWDELVYDKKNWIGLNTGSFLIRNCQWSLDLLDAWAPMGPKGAVRTEAGKLLSKSLIGRPDQFEADDQSALVYLLSREREAWGAKVFLESGYYLHGYWAIIVERYEEMMEKYEAGYGDDRWPFVTHFVGCKPCGSHGDYPVEKCLKHMERAFNFADNQVLGMYGFRHRSLGSYKVKRIRNDTHRPIDHGAPSHPHTSS